jgi:hypothetical protein
LPSHEEAKTALSDNVENDSFLADCFN